MVGLDGEQETLPADGAHKAVLDDVVHPDVSGLNLVKRTGLRKDTELPLLDEGVEGYRES